MRVRVRVRARARARARVRARARARVRRGNTQIVEAALHLARISLGGEPEAVRLREEEGVDEGGHGEQVAPHGREAAEARHPRVTLVRHLEQRPLVIALQAHLVRVRARVRVRMGAMTCGHRWAGWSDGLQRWLLASSGGDAPAP